MGANLSKHKPAIKKLIRSTTVSTPWSNPRWAYTSRIEHERGHASDDASTIWHTHYRNDAFFGARMHAAYCWIVENAPADVVGVPLYEGLVLGEEYEPGRIEHSENMFQGRVVKGVLDARDDGWRGWNEAIESLVLMTGNLMHVSEFRLKKVFWGSLTYVYQVEPGNVEALLPILEGLSAPDPPRFFQHHTLRLSIALVYENVLYAAWLAAKQRQCNEDEGRYVQQMELLRKEMAFLASEFLEYEPGQ